MLSGYKAPRSHFGCQGAPFSPSDSILPECSTLKTREISQRTCSWTEGCNFPQWEVAPAGVAGESGSCRARLTALSFLAHSASCHQEDRTVREGCDVGFICSSNNHRKKPHAPKTQVQKRIHRMIVRHSRRKGCSRDSKEQSACWNQELSPNLTFFCVREWRNGRGGGNVLGSDIKPSHTRLQEVAGRQMEQG